jgi:hypothetical protein
MKVILLTGLFFSGSERGVWSGVLSEEDGELSGETIDAYGMAQLSHVSLDEANGTFAFVKRYYDRTDDIRYQFSRDENRDWVGHFNGGATGLGGARCSLVVRDERYFEPPKPPLVSAN